MSREIHPVMVGTAGHIDHGKSTLVKTLTGIDPDRWEEERVRGMTIDLGFAPMKMADGRLLGMVDVPGHERFVRNMVAGSTGLDLAILVVAADDAVMPQTREHLNIVHLLGVRGGIVALTKVDLVDDETLELATDEVRELLAGTCMADAEIVPICALTGQGMESFKQKLEALAAAVPPRRAEGPFRMPIQRVFTLKGIGTVVTGIPVSGSVAVGDVLELLPQGRRSKVRSVQAFGGEVQRAVAGHSTALNLPDAKAADVGRGSVVAAPEVFRCGDTVDIELTILGDSPPLSHRDGIRFHTGTVECKGILLLLDRERLQPGEACAARVVLEQEVAAVYGDRFLLRLMNPVVTVGGGQVLRLTEQPRRYRRRATSEELQALLEAGPGAASRVLEELRRVGVEGLGLQDLPATLGLTQAEVDEALEELGDQVGQHRRAGQLFLQEVLEDGKAMVRHSVERLLKDKPLAASIHRNQLQTSKSLPPVLLTASLAALQEAGEVESAAHGRLLFRERLRDLDAADQARLDKLAGACAEAGFRPPTPKELQEATGIAGKPFHDLLARAVDVGLIEVVGEHLYAGATVRKALFAIFQNCSRHDDELVIPELRDELGTSRKYLIPLLEYVDGLGMTRLRGGQRRLLRTSPVSQGIADAIDRSGGTAGAAAEA